jgi:cation transporter-like permease
MRYVLVLGFWILIFIWLATWLLQDASRGEVSSGASLALFCVIAYGATTLGAKVKNRKG